MNIEKSVFNKLNKVELKSQKFEFGIVDVVVSERGRIADDYVRAQGLASDAMDKIEPILKNIIIKANNNLDKISDAKKMASDLGVEVPKEIIDSEAISKNQIKDAQIALGQISKINF